MEPGDFLPSQAVVDGVKKDLEAHNVEREVVAREVKSKVLRFVGLAVAAIVVCFAVVVLLFPSYPWVSTPYMFALVAAALALLFAYSHAVYPGIKFQQSMRERLFPTIFSYVDDFSYSHDARPQSFERVPVAATGSHNRQSFDDMFSGTYGGFPFEFYEVKLHQEQRSGGNNNKTTTHTVFIGIIFAFRSPVRFDGVLVARRTSPAFMRFFRDLFGGGGFDTVTTGDPSIDGSHEFRSNNPEAARALINDDLVKALDYLHEAWPEQPGRIALSGDDGFVLIPSTKDRFELPGIKVPLVYEAHVEPIIADFAKVFATAALMRASLERRAEVG